MQKKSKQAKEPETFVCYKGFDANLKCRDFQYEIGKTYTHIGPVVQCESGFHACQNPLDVLDFYGFENGNRFARVTVGGKVDRSDDKKWASAEITVQAELKLPDLIGAAIKWIMDACKTGENVQTASGDYSQLAASGDSSKLAASGDSSKLAASGYSSKLAASGDYSKLEITGKNGVIAAAAPNCTAKGVDGTWIALPEFDGNGLCVGFATGCIGQGGLLAGTVYKALGGRLVLA